MKEENRFGLGAFICIFNKDYSEILLLYRSKKKRERWGADWGNIGGVVEFGETSRQGAVREAYEEIGIKLKPSDLKLIAVKLPREMLDKKEDIIRWRDLAKSRCAIELNQ